MKKQVVATLVLIIILVVIAAFYFDIFNLRYSKEAVIASIIAREDTRLVSSKLVECLSDPDPEIRARATLAIGRIGEVESVDLLFGLLDDSTNEVAETAALAIGLSGSEVHAERLLTACDRFSPDLLAISLQAVGHLSDSTMMDIIDELASYLDHLDHRVREQAAYALWRSGGKSSAGKLADVCRNDPVRPVQVAALYSLVRMGIKEPADLYAEWLPDADPYVRSLALRGLSLDKESSKISLIASGLNDRNNNVVSQAISSLTSIGTSKAVGFLVARYANETDEKLKVQLLKSLTQLGAGAAENYALDDIHSESTSLNIKAAAIVYLAKIKGEETIPLIDSLVELNDWFLSTRIAEALSEIGGENVRPRLMSLFKGSSAAVRVAAFEALCNIDSINLNYYLKTALADSDFVVVSQAVDRIGQLKRRDYLSQLMTIIQMRDRAETDLKRSVVAAVGRILEEGADSLAEDILYRALLDNDYLVSREAAWVYREKLGIDKSAFINKPFGLLSERNIKKQLGKYRKNPYAVIYTNRGEIEMELFFDVAPLTVYNFIKLSRQGFYDNLTFHRVVPNFVIQGGDPHGDGSGGPGYSIRCEYSNLTFGRGAVGIAHSGKDSGGSQFFITLSSQPHLDSRYTLFGKVVRGMEVVDGIVRGDTIRMIRIAMHEKE